MELSKSVESQAGTASFTSCRVSCCQMFECNDARCVELTADDASRYCSSSCVSVAREQTLFGHPRPLALVYIQNISMSLAHFNFSRHAVSWNSTRRTSPHLGQLNASAKAVANVMTVMFDLVQMFCCGSSTATSIDKMIPVMWIRPTRHLQQVKLDSFPCVGSVACDR